MVDTAHELQSQAAHKRTILQETESFRLRIIETVPRQNDPLDHNRQQQNGVGKKGGAIVLADLDCDKYPASNYQALTNSGCKAKFELNSEGELDGKCRRARF